MLTDRSEPCRYAAAGAAAISKQRQLQPRHFGKLFLQICSQQEMSPERVIQGVATALDLPIRQVTVVDVAEVDSVANALKLALRQPHAKQHEHFYSWPWNNTNGGRKVTITTCPLLCAGITLECPPTFHPV